MDCKQTQSSPKHHGNSPPRKPKRPPPITPKRFNRFFTPRRTGSSTQSSNASRKLRDITSSAINRASSRRVRSKPQFQGSKAQPDILTPATTPKKRKADDSFSPPCISSPIKRTRFSSTEIPSSPPQLDAVPENEVLSTPSHGREESPEPVIFCQPIKRISSSKSIRIMERTFGDRGVLGHGIHNDLVLDFNDKSANFYSSPDDVLNLPNAPGLLTFSMASFHTKSLVAMGLEGGKILIQDTTSDAAFSSPYVYLDAHINAVMDLDVSEDDSMIASASGDQIAKIIDVSTRRVKAKFDFDQACGTLKQVRFQPGNPFVVATTCREGFINIWDTRCHGKAQMESKPGPRPTKLGPLELSDEPTSCSTYTTPFLSIASAHGDRSSLLASGSHISLDAERGHVTRHGKVSVTSLSFLSSERSHMLVTGCDASASIRVWDIRARYNRRSGSLPVPVSATTVPSNHATHRAFGLTSLILNSAGSMLYAVARDNVVYAYSTSHLILGHAPELDTNSAIGSISSFRQQRFSSEGRTGLGPLYGFRNKNLHVGSFYIKAAMRPLSCGKSEMLAVGSTSACTVLFPTDERDFDSERRRQRANTIAEDDENPNATPVYELGTVLTNGHEKEVSALAWTYDGNLVTSDDRRVSRCWREDEQEARRCRRTGVRDCLTATCGWADIVEEDVEDCS